MKILYVMVLCGLFAAKSFAQPWDADFSKASIKAATANEITLSPVQFEDDKGNISFWWVKYRWDSTDSAFHFVKMGGPPNSQLNSEAD